MGTWDNVTPCRNCGKEHGQKIKCEDCGTLGCADCVGTNMVQPGFPPKDLETHCLVCGNSTIKRVL